MFYVHSSCASKMKNIKGKAGVSSKYRAGPESKKGNDVLN